MLFQGSPRSLSAGSETNVLWESDGIPFVDAGMGGGGMDSGDQVSLYTLPFFAAAGKRQRVQVQQRQRDRK